jgi:alanine racemase
VTVSPGAGTHIATGGDAMHFARTAPPLHRPTWAQIDLAAIAANVTALKAQADAPRLMAVVKADGYGHGAVPAAQAALAGGADWLAVALVEEGEELRHAGVTAPILVMTEPPVDAVPGMIAARLTPTVYTPTFLNAVDAAGRDEGESVAVHLKLDTGMRRVGVPQADWEDAFALVRQAQGVRLESIWSHFAVADEPHHSFITHQAQEFARALALARTSGLDWDFAHLCNSAGTLHLHEHHYDMVRPGLAVYGLEPAPGLAGDTLLRPAMSWWSRLSLVKRLAAGESVSYGLRWTAQRDTTLGTVPAGYADGVTRLLSNRGEVVIREQRLPIAGTVCMDQFVVDGGDLPLSVGDDVCLLGRQGDAAVTADDWATWLDTINYEIVCGVGKRVPRVYVGSPAP